MVREGCISSVEISLPWELQSTSNNLWWRRHCYELVQPRSYCEFACGALRIISSSRLLLGRVPRSVEHVEVAHQMLRNDKFCRKDPLRKRRDNPKAFLSLQSVASPAAWD